MRENLRKLSNGPKIASPWPSEGKILAPSVVVIMESLARFGWPPG